MTNNDAFYRLAPFIREYIYTHGWTELRDVQLEACKVIFDTDDHLLLAAGTASGKTEAAFLPVLTQLHEKPSSTIGVLYIGPLKALINDQFLRLDDLLKEVDIPVWHWHGDVSQSHKNRFMKDPRGILQITPESLESMIINRDNEISRIFGDLRFIIIDEVHVFMESDRGRQVLCLLERLSRYFEKEPRRIGLSATLGDYSLAEKWLGSGTKRRVATPKTETSQQKIRLAVEHFYISDPIDSKSKLTISSKDEVKEQNLTTDKYYEYIHSKCKAQKCLIFANNRTEAEQVITNLRQIAKAKSLPDIYHVHHGSISASLREAAEQAMRAQDHPAVTAATVTLELGIDIGHLERVIQLGAPFSVSSFLQRLGRSGRRGSPPEMWFACYEEASMDKGALPAQIPWQLIQTIAIIQLYLEERWIEPIEQKKCPFSLMYHQIMSILITKGELSPAALAQKVLTLSPFKEVSQEDFKELLRHLIKIDHIQLTERKGLIVGLAGEQLVRSFRFYAVFAENVEYTVKDDTSEIGSIINPPPPGERFALAGNTWVVVEIDPKNKIVYSKKVNGRVRTYWSGGGGGIHIKLLQRMRKVLFEEKVYPYLKEKAKERLQIARDFARRTELDKKSIFYAGNNEYYIFPWMGTNEFRTLDRWLRVQCSDVAKIRNIGGLPPYYLTIQSDVSNSEELLQVITNMAEREISPYDLVGEEDAPQLQKYDEFIPHNLLRKAFVTDYLDIRAMKGLIGDWK
ncbi:DEAD/DEAH box helicase [Ruminiclostridium cellulolyticum]|uniref:DEAD/DEAH box helicase domain protein n=1 Tax=Ruminiclostridium cellulolyticum (strain ATCC 35319 / DSM 5812 / JCM 6584 / H10) TaxID=394503 RepID=B8I966_RUMCH|nr:DEAD/DEAH box helicase [Ruminiclostridium cellulolyticum]ACL75326.1 DEAD/DEAH box helicase domain protein [Ruminiclostridium cellulolyticum H10]